ncbi:MAG: alpha-L-arabinofuranosidase AbfB [Anaerolineae bacterium]
MNRITIRTPETENGAPRRINRHIYGHFAEHLGRCIYDGLYVGEESAIPNTRGFRKDIIEALRAINIPNLRWPGGCFADEYHWRDGIGPKDQRPKRLNFWGNAPETNAVGTHEFLDLCEQLGCAPYFGGNVGSGTVQEMRDWVEYITSNYDSALSDLRRQNGREQAWPMPFWGIGNENWGCGGHMTPEQYADLYSQYHTFVRNYGDTPMMKIASGLGGTEHNGQDIAVFMDRVMNRRHPVGMDGVSIHFYVFFPQKPEHSATQFGEKEWFQVLHEANHMDHVIQQNSKVLDQYDPDKKIWLVVDEWGAWYPVEPGTNPAFLYQQSAVRDAVVAALTLHIFQAHCDRVQMANLAQTVNVLQALILTEGEKMLLTPTYHVFEMFKGHQDATLLPMTVESDRYTVGDQHLPAFSASASQAANGDTLLTLCNLKPSEACTIEVDLQDLNVSTVSGTQLVGDAINAHNTFDAPDRVKPSTFNGATLLENGQLRIELPAASVVALTLR